MDIHRDFKELLALLNEHNVEYVVVGGYALALHGAPRYTGDIDIFVRASKENARRIVESLEDFGLGSLGLTVDDFSALDNIVQIGMPPVRVDFITSLSGVSWEQVDATKVRGQFGDVPMYYIGREAFIANKRASGRKKDLADIEELGEE